MREDKSTPEKARQRSTPELVQQSNASVEIADKAVKESVVDEESLSDDKDVSIEVEVEIELPKDSQQSIDASLLQAKMPDRQSVVHEQSNASLGYEDEPFE